jgi:sporulation protein YlmC with PRC-barrel domain
MNVKKYLLGFIGLNLLFFSYFSLTGQEQTPDEHKGDTPGQEPTSVLLFRLDNIVGMPVAVLLPAAVPGDRQREAGEGIVPVGELRYLIVMPHGEITHALIQFSENTAAWDWWAGSGEYLVPINALTVHEELQGFILDPKRLEGQKISLVLTERTLEESLAADFVRVRQFIDYHVIDINQESAGALEDLVIDFKYYKIAQLILALDKTFTVKNKYFAVAFASIRYDLVKKEIQLYFSRSRFKEKKGWDLEQWLKSVNMTRECKVTWSEFAPAYGQVACFSRADRSRLSWR